MNRALSYVVFISIFLAFLVPTTAGATQVDWSKVIGAKPGSMNQAQKTRATSLITSISSTHQCKKSIAECIVQGDRTAMRHAGFIIRMVVKNKDDDYIKEGISKRQLASHPEEIASFDLTDRPHIGKTSAQVVIVEYACFQCPFCAHLAPGLQALKNKYGDKIVYYYKFFPVRSHKRGVPAALAALAAHKQGKFWKMHDLLYKNRGDLTDDDLKKYAAQLGLDMTKFEQTLKDTGTMKLIEKDKLEGMRNGVDGTPSFYINGKLFQGPYDIAELEDRIEEELEGKNR